MERSIWASLSRAPQWPSRFNLPWRTLLDLNTSPKQQMKPKLVRAAAVRMRSQADMFLLSSEAQCEAVEVTVEGPDYFTSLASDDHHDDDDHDDHNDDDHDEHHDDDDHDDHSDDDHDEHHDDDDHDGRDDDDHDDHQDDDDHDGHDDGDHNEHHDDDGHDDHDDHDEGTHNDVEASYLWNCENPERLQDITLRFTDWFADVDSVEVQLITPQGVQVLELDEGSNSVELGE